jgi:hypothetical protein
VCDAQGGQGGADLIGDLLTVREDITRLALAAAFVTMNANTTVFPPPVGNTNSTRLQRAKAARIAATASSWYDRRMGGAASLCCQALGMSGGLVSTFMAALQTGAGQGMDSAAKIG